MMPQEDGLNVDSAAELLYRFFGVGRVALRNHGRSVIFVVLFHMPARGFIRHPTRMSRNPVAKPVERSTPCRQLGSPATRRPLI